MATRMPNPDDVAAIEDLDKRGEAIRAYFAIEERMRTVRDDYIRQLRAADTTITITAQKAGVSDATVKNVAGPRRKKATTNA